MGDGYIRAWELHRDAPPRTDAFRIIFSFGDGFPSKGPEVGDGDFESAIKEISQRIQEGNFSGSSSNLLPVSSSAVQPILIYTLSVTSQVSQQDVARLQTFFRCVWVGKK